MFVISVFIYNNHTKKNTYCMTHNMKIKYPFYISENPFIYSLFHTAGFISHSVKYVSHTVVFVSHSVKQRIY